MSCQIVCKACNYYKNEKFNWSISHKSNASKIVLSSQNCRGRIFLMERKLSGGCTKKKHMDIKDIQRIIRIREAAPGKDRRSLLLIHGLVFQFCFFRGHIWQLGAKAPSLRFCESAQAKFLCDHLLILYLLLFADASMSMHTMHLFQHCKSNTSRSQEFWQSGEKVKMQ